jgi:hypothetical protein
MDEFTDFLFAPTGVIGGVARLVDLGGISDDYNFSSTGEEADRRALAADWLAVGSDLRAGTDKARTEMAALQPSLFEE